MTATKTKNSVVKYYEMLKSVWIKLISKYLQNYCMLYIAKKIHYSQQGLEY